MLKRKLKLGLVMGLVMTLVLIVLAGCTGPAGPAGPSGTGKLVFEKPTAPEPVVEATYTTVVPVLDGAIDPVWDRATELKVTMGGNFLDVPSTGIEVTLKFLYTDEDLYMLGRWPDPTLSIARFDAWLWEGTGWHTLAGSASEVETGLTGPTGNKSEMENFASDDGLGVMWAIDTPGFEEQGCMIKCHVEWKGEVDASIPEFVEWGEEVVGNPLHIEGACRTCHGTDELVWQQSGGYFDTEGAIADLWLMRSLRVSPLGYADDFSLNYDAAPHTTMGGRTSDYGARPYFHNNNQDLTAPLYMETNPTSYEDAMMILQSEIAMGEAVAVAGLTDEQISEYWANYMAIRIAVPTNYPYALVTPRVLNDLDRALTPEAIRGSRDDMLLVAKWSSGIWTAEYSRELVTGYTDDVQFDDFTAYYPFDIAIFDNTKAEGHSYHVGTPLNLVFAPPVIGEPPVVEEPPVVGEPTAPGALPPIQFVMGDIFIQVEGADLVPYGSGLTSPQSPPWTITVEKGSTIPITEVQNSTWSSNVDHTLTIEGTTLDIYVTLGATEGPFEVTFNEAGTFKVYCKLHPDEHGETLIVVTEGGVLPPGAGALPPIEFKLGDEYIQFVGDDLSSYGSGLTSPLDSRDGPWTVTVKKDSTMTITEVSTSGRPGTLDHTLTIEGTPIDVYLAAGETAGPFEVTFDEAGTFKVYCKLHPDEVHGTIVVEE